jgi:sugar lactone lactonase YvrE
MVSVSFPARLLKIPIRINGSAGPVEMLVSNATLTAAGIFALDDIVLDVHGNIYTTSPVPFVVSRISPDGKEISKVAGREQGLTASVVTLAFGTGKGNRKTIFAGYNQSFGGTGCGIVAIDAGVPGLPLP